ncbi:cryptochrome/photolyase family protein [Cognatiluteimonas weifangensis]|uniref:Deoxyribodipyrimidine photo-lyase n=1 Tax=Cognatiluteimonas weifangensis TaxID=2303539 RepID=A0A372DMR5_9GAMM|nr:deoxyribodipyrimidine photo-lyase [Luteimonas weifangensis]RFP60754.1 deoxyribodipyrimidine photo-lyase [Luteimonas weifangensis]
MSVALVWFRNDLRLADNPALQAALRAGLAPVPVYVHAPEEEGEWPPGAASDAWRQRSLMALDADLRARGSRLHLYRGPSLDTLQAVAAATGAEAVFWNRRYEPAVEQRDARIGRALRAQGLRAESCNGSLLFEPWELATVAGDPYRVFTPFWRAALARWRPQACVAAPATLAVPAAGDAMPPPGVALEALGLAPARGWDRGFWDHGRPGEAGAQAALVRFGTDALAGYPLARDRPDLPGSSRLSAHLHFGEIAPWRVVHVLAQAEGAAAAALPAFVRQLGWREFAHHVLHHFPHTPQRNFNPRFDAFRWAEPAARLLRAWQRGRTGIPIVDAGLRELWATGWMHNRVRMLVASLLSKHLRVHWLHGARWFWDTLVDADLANNTLGWQWVAGTGVDAAPYFRVFNPVLQARRFDPQGAYIARWVPELAALPAALRHEPWRDPAATAGRYPRPIVDLAAGRAAALAAYAEGGVRG